MLISIFSTWLQSSSYRLDLSFHQAIRNLFCTMLANEYFGAFSRMVSSFLDLAKHIAALSTEIAFFLPQHSTPLQITLIMKSAGPL